ncbi:MAG TPA: PaaI family thioesterase [Burkholderiales bacterium]
MTAKAAVDFKRFGDGYLPGLVGVEILTVTRELVESRLAVRREVMAPNGFLHAASVIALADTSCGYGCVAALPEGAKGFTTVELKANFLGTAREGSIACRATPVHLGRTTQVWDAVVTSEATGGQSSRPIALFRCTQMVLWQNPSR